MSQPNKSLQAISNPTNSALGNLKFVRPINSSQWPTEFYVNNRMLIGYFQDDSSYLSGVSKLQTDTTLHIPPKPANSDEDKIRVTNETLTILIFHQSLHFCQSLNIKELSITLKPTYTSSDVLRFEEKYDLKSLPPTVTEFTFVLRGHFNIIDWKVPASKFQLLVRLELLLIF